MKTLRSLFPRPPTPATPGAALRTCAPCVSPSPTHKDSGAHGSRSHPIAHGPQGTSRVRTPTAASGMQMERSWSQVSRACGTTARGRTDSTITRIAQCLMGVARLYGPAPGGPGSTLRRVTTGREAPRERGVIRRSTRATSVIATQRAGVVRLFTA